MIVKGYKGMHSDMACRGMQYEIGKTYHAIGAVELCRNGFHFCRRLFDAFKFYEREDGNRFFEVEANEIDTDGIKSVASEIRIIKELTEEEVNRAAYSDGRGDGYYFGCFGDGDMYGDRNGNGNGYGCNFGDGCGSFNGDGGGNGSGLNDGSGYGVSRVGGIQNILRFV